MYYKTTDDSYKNCIPVFLNNYYTFVNIQFIYKYTNQLNYFILRIDLIR